MNSDYLKSLVQLQKSARRRNDTMAELAIGSAIRQDEELAELARVLREIRNLPCLDGSVGLVCWMEKCPRCIARRALDVFETGR